ncbi:MAG TPA: heat-inducible transcription repressor HrcA [Candidatus Ornithoclostridium faecigallinarum]|nr:heat-inducible transcription repressor HrcA [Candidatus Ornithoclostridium faecigallinarum]
MDDRLSDRKKKVLNALVDSYITDAEPISSSAIKNKYMPDVSSATIRSELATLEELGYLVQPHVSSGRVPSAKAYRFYVDCLLSECGDTDVDGLDETLKRRMSSVEELVRETAKTVSDVTNYTSLMVLSGADSLTVKEVKLVDLYDDSALVLVITDAGVIKDKTVAVPKDADGNYIELANRILNATFAGKSLAEIGSNAPVLEENIEGMKALVDEVIRLLAEYKRARESELYLEGADKIFQYPEARDVDNVRSFVSIISKKEKLHDLVAGDGDLEIDVKIGEQASEDLKHMALVTARYSVDGKEIGHVGVIGPERMDYKKVMSVLRQLVRAFDKKDNDPDTE